MSADISDSINSANNVAVADQRELVGAVTGLTLIPQPNGGALLPPMRPGETRNPAGRPSAGACFIEWINQMRDWTEDELEAVADDPRASHTKRKAARSSLRSLADGFTKTGIPIAANDLDRILDRTEGKPGQRLSIDNQRLDTQGEVWRTVMADPDLRAKLAELYDLASERARGGQVGQGGQGGQPQVVAVQQGGATSAVVDNRAAADVVADALGAVVVGQVMDGGVDGGGK